MHPLEEEGEVSEQETGKHELELDQQISEEQNYPGNSQRSQILYGLASGARV